MHRLMAVPMSVATLMIVVQTSAAQPVDSNSSGSRSTSQGSSVSAPIGAGDRTQPAAASTSDLASVPPAGDQAQAAQDAATNIAEREDPTDSGTYGVRLRDLEQRINELKEQIFRSKARLSLLAETVLQGVVAGSQARIVHENKMGNSYKLVKVVYSLDGAPIFNKSDEDGGLGDVEAFDIYNGSMVPGEHTLSVRFEYRGHGYGIFSYLKGYRFKVSSSHTFTAPEGKALTLDVVGYESGGPTTPLEQRPAVRFAERVTGAAQPGEDAAAATGAGGN